jgi:DNA-binding transcriptional LysR family regulator
MLRKLEAWLGLPLFTPEVRRLVPTASARQYHQRISPALSMIVQATTAARGRVPHEVRISMPPGLAAKWFAPRMGQGVVLTSPLLTEAERSSGARVEPFNAVLELDVGYDLVRPEGSASRAGIRAMIDWLHEEFDTRSDGA